MRYVESGRGWTGRAGGPRLRVRRGSAVVAVALALLLLATGCQPSGPRSTGSAPLNPSASASDPGPSAEPSTPGSAPDFDGQRVEWTGCAQGMECGRVEVPLDWAHPGGKTIELAVIRSTPTGTSKGTLWVNPGGPGGSGVDLIRDSLDYVTTAELRANYTIAGFDPRGVGASTAVDCFTDSERDAMRESTADPATDEGLKELEELYRKFADACQANTGDLLAHVDTVSAARDLDVLRAVGGDKKLNYLGFSYGTFLGSTYASLFPEKVGRLVLDGALDPSLSNADLALGQAKGFEAALHAYVEDCQSRQGCPLTGDVEQGVRTVGDLIDSVQKAPLRATDGRTVGASLLTSGIIVPLYNDANWPALTQGLAAALKGDPDALLQLADLSSERDPDGEYIGNGDEAFLAINCLDYPMEQGTAAMRAEAAELVKASPTFGSQLGYSGATCTGWPHAPLRKPAPVSAPGAAPILVVGTTGDPATPYPWAEALAGQLESATLLTWEGEGHTAYGRAGGCIDSAVDAYFISGTMPPKGTRCQ